MSITPLIHFKAGKCEGDFESAGPTKVKPIATPGFLYLYSEDDLIHFCWRARDQTLENPDIRLVMVPTDGSFQPYLTKGSPVKKSPVNGRIFVLRFQSSSTRHLFWLQSAAKDPSTPSFFSRGDLKLGDIVDRLLQGEDPESTAAEGLASLRGNRHDGGDDEEDDADEAMEDADISPDGTASNKDHRRSSGGAGADATGGDFREEGEDSRGGGGDGARAVSASNTALPNDANAAIQNFLNSLGPAGSASTMQRGRPQTQGSEDPFTTLVDLLPSSVTVPMLASPTTTDAFLANLIVRHLPSSLLYLAHGMDPAEIPDDHTDSDPEAVAALADALEPEQKKDLLRRVLRSPQFHQALVQITQALRDGGLPAVAGAVGVQVEGRGYYNESAGIPMNGGNAVKAFLAGVKKSVDEEQGPGKE